MASEIDTNWTAVPLSDLTEDATPITYGVVKPGDEGTIRFVRGGDIANGRVALDQLRTISAEVSQQYRRTILRGGEILVSLVGNPGQVAIAPSELAGANIARQVGLVRLKQEVCTPFVKYSLLSPVGQQALGAQSLGSVQQVINLRDLKTVKVPLPPIAEQRAIANILGVLDDKIELNRRMNETLEGLARAIFQSWFVDFDPVRAQRDGLPPPALSPPTAALFPDSFEDSELGKIPKGWSIDTIKNRASNVQYGYTQSASPEPVGPRFLRITDIRGGQVDWSAVPFCKTNDDELEKYRIKDGDIFVARTGASTGDNIYIVDPPDAVFASYLVRFQFASAGIGRFIGEFMRTPDYFSHVTGSIGGSAQPNASAQTLADATVVFPTKDVADSFYKTIRPLDLKRSANSKETERLAAIRDALLPKLLSGEIRAAEVERIVGRNV